MIWDRYLQGCKKRICFHSLIVLIENFLCFFFYHCKSPFFLFEKWIFSLFLVMFWSFLVFVFVWQISKKFMRIFFSVVSFPVYCSLLILFFFFLFCMQMKIFQIDVFFLFKTEDRLFLVACYQFQLDLTVMWVILFQIQIFV